MQPDREVTPSNVEKTAEVVALALQAGYRHIDTAQAYGTERGVGAAILDLFLIHWPLPTLYGGDYVSTWKAVTEFVAEGRLRSAGVSNFQPAHLDRIIAETGIVPAVNQFELHPYFANQAARAATRRHGIAVEAHSPLGHNGKPLSDETIAAIAAAHGRSPAQVILRRHMRHGHIAIPKSARPERMRGESGRAGPNPDTYEGI